MKKVTQVDKKKMVWLDMQHIPQGKIAQRIGISQGRVSHYIRLMKETGEYADLKRELQGSEPVSFDDDTPADDPEPKMKNTGINPEFEQAVDAMIAEREAADAENKSANAEPERLPGVVCRAIDAGFHDLADEIDKRRNRIEELEAEIVEFEKDIAALRAWREKHK